MKIKFIKEYCTCFRDEENTINTETFKPDDTVSTSMEVDSYFTEELARWLIDNGFAEEVKESGWWKPEFGERYHYFGSDGETYSNRWENDSLDNGRLKLGSVFKTKKATERYRDYWKAVTMVRQDEGVLVPERLKRIEKDSDCAFYIGFGHTGILDVGALDLYENDVLSGAIFFDTKGHAQASLDKHSDEWKTIANYDWSRE